MIGSLSGATASVLSSTLAASMPGVRKTTRKSAERYEAQASYQRFDQQFNLTRQRFWQPDAIALWDAMVERRHAFVRAGRHGYSRLDWAFANAASANQVQTGFGINAPNLGPTGWSSRAPEAPKGTPPWNGDGLIGARAIKKMARIFGAGDVGITGLDRRWVYGSWFDEQTKQSYPLRFSDEPGFEAVTAPTQLPDRTQVIPASMRNVVVMVLPMDRTGIRTAPTLTQFASTQTTYSEISFLVASVAEFIRGLGYNAIPAANDTALSIPLAIDAGLGELGRNAKLIHPVWGPLCRICKVITDLPLAPDSPIETGASAFCDSCGKCADACPAGAIPSGPRSFEPVGQFSNAGVKVWQMDHMKCLAFWSKCGTNCGICLAACPFSKGKHWSHQITKAAIARMPRLDPLISALDDTFGYGKTDPDGFWSDVASAGQE